MNHVRTGEKVGGGARGLHGGLCAAVALAAAERAHLVDPGPLVARHVRVLPDARVRQHRRARARDDHSQAVDGGLGLEVAQVQPGIQSDLRDLWQELQKNVGCY